MDQAEHDQATFLLVDDSEDDVLLVRRSFIKGSILNPLQVVTSGEQAIAYLDGLGKYADRLNFPLPEVVLLDLRMPQTDGFEVLRWVRTRPHFRDLRVVVLTGSTEIRDVNLAYSLGANSFLIKPMDFDKFVEISQALNGCWLWQSKKSQRPLPTTNNPASFRAI